MGGAFFSDSWYRVAGLKPRLRDHGKVHRHRYRGEVWYVLQDRASGRVHRFTPAAYRVIGRMDGSTDMAAIWQACVHDMGDAAPSQEDVIQLLGQLHGADLLRSDITPDAQELFERAGKRSRPILKSNLKSPLSIRIPLWDPDRFLRATLPYVAPLFGGFGALLWLAVVLPAIVLAGVHWPELTRNFTDRVLGPQNLALLWLIVPIVKLFHEMGHAYATRVDGGEVHELGVMLLVLTPTPYVDSSAANAFRSKWRRALVGAAGMLVEVFLASLAMYVWLGTEPGWIRGAAFNVMLICGVSTVVFNINPLLRFDGYYIFSDLIEIPNLGNRANRYWSYLLHRHVFGRGDDERMDATAGERRWFLVFAPAALLYRLTVTFSLALFLASQYLFVGVVVALWGLFQGVVAPLGKMTHHLVTSPRLAHRRRRAYSVTAAALALCLLLLFALPMPLRTTAEGVIWLPEQALVRAGESGFVSRLLQTPGSTVRPGDPLVESAMPEYETELARAQAELQGLDVRYAAELQNSRVRAMMIRRQMDAVEARVARARERVSRLVASAGDTGVFVVAQAADMPGRFYKKGQTLAYVTRDDNRIIRVLVAQADIELVREHTIAVEARLPDRMDRTFALTLLREVPAAQEELPSRVFGSEGGGTVASDPRDASGTRALQRWFQFDMALPEGMRDVPLGSRVYVRFSHDWESLGMQLYRRLRQLFLSSLHV